MNKSVPICPVCHDPVPGNATECPNCGAALSLEVSAPSVDEVQTLHCSRCQREYQEGMRFCPYCGLAFSADSQVEGQDKPAGVSVGRRDRDTVASAASANRKSKVPRFLGIANVEEIPTRRKHGFQAFMKNITSELSQYWIQVLVVFVIISIAMIMLIAVIVAFWYLFAG